MIKIIREELPKQIQYTRKPTNETMQARSPVFCWPLTPAQPACPGVWFAHSDTPLGKKRIFPLPASINCKQLLGQRWHLVSLSPSQCWDFALKLCRSSVCCHSLVCSSVLLCLEGTVSFESPTTSGFYNLSASSSTYSEP